MSVMIQSLNTDSIKPRIETVAFTELIFSTVTLNTDSIKPRIETQVIVYKYNVHQDPEYRFH